MPNNTPANGAQAASGSGHANTNHFCSVGTGQESITTSHGPNGQHDLNDPNTSNDHTGPDGPDAGPDGERGLGATLVGGASGHFLAQQLGHGHSNGHHGVLGSAAGAVAANLIEYQLKKSHNQHAHYMGHSGGGTGGLSGMFGGGHHQQQQQHHQEATHHGQYGQEYVHEYGDDHGQGGVNPYQANHGLGHGNGGKHGKWGH